MMTPRHLADAIGRKKIANALRVKQSAVSNAVVRGSFPTAWFDALEQLAHSEGLECPRSVFSFVPLDNSQDVDCGAKSQGAGK